MSGTIKVSVLAAIAAATASPVGFGYVNHEDGAPLQDAGYIITNATVTNPANANEVAAKITDTGSQFLAGQQTSAGTAPAAAGKTVESVGHLVSGFVAPAHKRRGNLSGVGAPSKYPFDKLELNGSFFVGNSEVDKGDAFKTLSATVSSANRRNSEETGETIEVKRAQRGPDRKAIVGADGKKIMETVTEKKRKPLKHYKIVAVEGGKVYGDWTAPEAGAVIIRDL